MISNKDFFEEIINWTFPGLTFYYRDIELPLDIVEKYEKNLIFRSATFVDCSALAGYPTKNCRFIFASSKGIPLFKLNPETEKWKLCTINANSCFQILDIYKNSGVTQILALHIPVKGIEFFKKAVFKMDEIDFLDQIIEKSRESLRDKLHMEIIKEFEDREWLNKTLFPIGLDYKNDFFH